MGSALAGLPPRGFARAERPPARPAAGLTRLTPVLRPVLQRGSPGWRRSCGLVLAQDRRGTGSASPKGFGRRSALPWAVRPSSAVGRGPGSLPRLEEFMEPSGLRSAFPVSRIEALVGTDDAGRAATNDRAGARAGGRRGLG